jgi:hypothetical protein
VRDGEGAASGLAQRARVVGGEGFEPPTSSV